MTEMRKLLLAFAALAISGCVSMGEPTGATITAEINSDLLNALTEARI